MTATDQPKTEFRAVDLLSIRYAKGLLDEVIAVGRPALSPKLIAKIEVAAAHLHHFTEMAPVEYPASD